MDYDLHALGPRNFEHVAQALASKLVTTRLSVFGDGPDGGREATWNGPATSMGNAANWDGYGVVQAKFRVHMHDPSDNLEWVKSAITSELGDWAKPGGNRQAKPDYLLFVTNVRLSPDPRAGKDAANRHLHAKIKELSLPIRDARLWDYDDLRTHLDDAENIRSRYAAFITPGDLIAAVLRDHAWARDDFADAMQTYLARTILDDDLLNLTQAGAVGDGRISMADVFMDLPYGHDGRSSRSLSDSVEGIHGARISGRNKLGKKLATDLIGAIDSTVAGLKSHEQSRFVLIGGPGQGKSTVTQWIAQAYRARFLESTTAANSADVRGVLDKIAARADAAEVPLPRGRRWPFRVTLSALAEELVRSPGQSLITYIASRVSHRSSYTVQPSDVRDWLRLYPSLLLIDGLDEVPESSNRREVMQCLRDFFIDTSAIEADVAAIATTRPQGYTDEFSPEEYLHLNLAPLGVDEALSYASSLVAIRTGNGTPDYEKVVGRLKDASQEESTGRLFETPLQVTILTVLLEKLGKAPRDRSRLFSSYYEVIAQREQEKSGNLSRLLQKYESDVLELHRSIGLTLQQRGAEAGETSATLAPLEFETLVAEQFRRHQHSEEEVADLQKQFTQLIMDRLVFLSVVAADRIGFELRSLQEFMAAEQLVHRREQEILPALREYASVAYWRNVILFAVGAIFARREHLRGDVLVLCVDLNSADAASTVTLPGSDLALDILVDGSSDSMPLYSGSIADLAAQLIQRPDSDRLGELAELREPAVRRNILRVAADLTPTSPTVWLNRLVLLDDLVDEGVVEASAALARTASEVSDGTLRTIWPQLVVVGASHAAEVLKDRIGVADPIALLNVSRPVWTGPVEADEHPIFVHLEALRRFPHAESGGPRENLVEAVYTPLGANEEAWRWVQTVDSDQLTWRALRTVATFAIRKDAGTLADALRASCDLPDGFVLFGAPWVLTACWQAVAGTEASGSGDGRSERLDELARSAERGLLGTPERWGELEGSAPPSCALNADDVIRLALEAERVSASTEGHPPFAAASEELPLIGRYFTVTTGLGIRQDAAEISRKLIHFHTDHRDAAGIDAVTSLIETLASASFGSLMRNGETIDKATTEHMSELIAWGLGEALNDRQAIAGTRWNDWLRAMELVPWDDRWIGGLDRIGRSRDAVLPRFRTSKALFDLVASDSATPGLVRLAIATNPSLAWDSEVRSSITRVAQDAPEDLGALPHSVNILWAHDPWDEQLDEEIRQLTRMRDQLGLPWLLWAVRLKPAKTLELSARVARDLGKSDPTWASYFFEVASDARPAGRT